ncbi:MAG: YceD family protein [Caldimonas sp.]
MSSRGFDPTRLDVEAFAAEGGELEGRWPLAGFDRLCASAAAGHPPTAADEVAWQARGERAALRGGLHETWLHLVAEAKIPLQCQRCLAPVDVALAIGRKFLFVPGEDAAAQLDAIRDDDVLAMTRALDLHELVEDELLLALPLVPLHDACLAPLSIAAGEGAAPERPNPFAALAALKRDGPVN